MKRHLKRHVTPVTWRILKKEQKFVVRPHPGPHTQELSMPLNRALKQLNLAATTQEVKKLLNTKEVLVDGRRVTEHKLPVGLMDTITVKATNTAYRVVLDAKGYLKMIPIKPEEAQVKLCRINRKTMVTKGKLQLGTNDSRTMLVDKDEYKTGDSVLLEVPSQKIKKRLAFEAGMKVLLFGGKNKGEYGIIKDIQGTTITYETKQGPKETLKAYAFVVGKGNEEVTLT